MNLEEQLAHDLLDATRAGDDVRKRTLRMILAGVKNATIAARKPLDDEGVIIVLQHQAKMRREAMEQFERGGRADLVAAEQAELGVIETYLPRQLDQAEIEAEVRRQIASVGATGPGDVGRVTGATMKALAGRADGRVVNETVRRLLSGA